MSDITIFADGQCISVDGLNKGKLNVPGMKTHLDTIINDDPPQKKNQYHEFSHSESYFMQYT